MFVPLIVYSLITLAESLDHTDRCHTDNDCTGLTKCSSTGLCAILKVGILGLVGAMIACSILGACVYINISYVIRKYVEYSEIVPKNIQLTGQQKEETNGHNVLCA